jgi:outer membrane protein
MNRFIFVFLITVCALSTSFAQKYGHVNFGNLLSMMPEVESAEAKLQAYEKEQVAVGDGMATTLQGAYLEAQKNQENLTPKQLKEIEADLQKQQTAIQQFEQQMGVNIEKKRQELLGPIIQKAKDMVNAVAKEGGFKLVFDSSIFGSVLFAAETTDLMPAVKAKMGIE